MDNNSLSKKQQSQVAVFPLIILGAGPAGLSASIYASRYKIEHLVLGFEPGGYLNEIHKIENYPGFESISGFELSEKMLSHTQKLGGQVVQDLVLKIEIGKDKNKNFEISTSGSKKYLAKNVLYCIGTKQRHLGVPGEEKLLGKGVSYCATCDGPFYKNKTVAVVGGGNSAAAAALMLSNHASKIFLIHRGSELSCTPSYIEQIKAESKIETILNTQVVEILGENKVESINLIESTKSKTLDSNSQIEINLPTTINHQLPTANHQLPKTVPVDGIFVEIGSAPNTKMLQELGIELDNYGYIKTNSDQSTNLSGFFAAGDITTNSNGFRQIITACAEGAVAVFSIFNKIKSSSK